MIGILIVGLMILPVGSHPVQAEPVVDLSCSGLKRVGFSNPVDPIVSAGPLGNQGLVADLFVDGSFGVFILDDSTSVTTDSEPGVYDYIMSGWTYLPTVYCDEVICPEMEEIAKRIQPVDDQFGSFVSLAEKAQKAGCFAETVSVHHQAVDIP